ncbi:uncharacterized protein LOC135499844 [Lineus longissimus]|uniref:uncharacterized protein LOC135499844 n=1 Tax=Lineus longissimus TaxID=88925 RepID=UPI00315DBB2C
MSKNTIRKELECSICKDLLREPKVVGPCLHTFCRECILQLVECGDDPCTQFRCPICRAECCLPREGVSGLKTNFTLANLVEIFRGDREPTTSEISEADPNAVQEPTVPCTMCSVTGRKLQATCMCETCKYITMCDICKRQHETATATAEHVLVELCARHGKPEDLYCMVCKSCVCQVCAAIEHGSQANGSHNVKDIKPIIKESLKNLGTMLDFAEKKMLESLRASRETIGEFNRKFHNRQEALKSAVVAQSNVLAAPDLLEREKLAGERTVLLEMLKALDLKGARLDRNDADRQEKTICLLDQIDSISDEKTSKAQSSIDNSNTFENELCTAIRMGQRLKSAKMIGSNRNRNLIKTAGLLRDMTVRLKKDMDTTSYERELSRMPAYSHSSDDLGSLITFYARKIFDFDVGAAPRYDGDILTVTVTKEGIFAALCKNETEQKVLIWTKDVPTVHRVIEKSMCQFIDRLVSMASSPDNKIVLLRKKAPQLVVVSPSLGTIKTLKVHGLKDPGSIAVGLDGLFLVIEDVWPASIFVINEKGEIIHTLPTKRVPNPRICGHYVIFTCDWRRLFPYSVKGAGLTIITKQGEFEHKIPDFNVIDLTLGNDSDMFVIGMTGCAELKLYRLKKVLEAEDTPLTYDEFILTDKNGLKRGPGLKAKSPISLDVCGPHMIIAYKDLNDQSCAVYYNLATVENQMLPASGASGSSR